jgi:hypothetical protein
MSTNIQPGAYVRRALADLRHLQRQAHNYGRHRDAQGYRLVADLLTKAVPIRLKDREHYKSQLITEADLAGLETFPYQIFAFEYEVTEQPGTHYRGLSVEHVPKRIALAFTGNASDKFSDNGIWVISVFALPADTQIMETWVTASSAFCLPSGEIFDEPLIDQKKDELGETINTYKLLRKELLPDTAAIMRAKLGSEQEERAALNDIYEELDTAIKALITLGSTPQESHQA